MNSMRLFTPPALFCLAISVAWPCVSKAHHPHYRYRCHSAASAKEQVDAFQTGLTALQENRFEDALVALTAAEYEHSEDREFAISGASCSTALAEPWKPPNTRKPFALIRALKMPIEI